MHIDKRLVCSLREPPKMLLNHYSRVFYQVGWILTGTLMIFMLRFIDSKSFQQYAPLWGFSLTWRRQSISWMVAVLSLSLSASATGIEQVMANKILSSASLQGKKQKEDLQLRLCEGFVFPSPHFSSVSSSTLLN